MSFDFNLISAPSRSANDKMAYPVPKSIVAYITYVQVPSYVCYNYLYYLKETHNNFCARKSPEKLPSSLNISKTFIQNCANSFLKSPHQLSIFWLHLLFPYRKTVFWSQVGSFLRRNSCNCRTVSFSVPRSTLTLLGQPRTFQTASMKYPAISRGLLLVDAASSHIIWLDYPSIQPWIHIP